MSKIDFSFDDARFTVTYRLRGPTITSAEMAASYQEIANDERLKPNMHSIWDVSDLDFRRIPIAEIRALPKAMNQLMKRRGSGFKVAIVTSRSADQQLLKMYLAIIKLIGNFKFRLFVSIAQAQAWITTEREA